MKKAIFAIAILTISLTDSAWAQGRRRAPRQPLGSTAMGGGSGIGIKTRRTMNLGDTATHEVGHKGKRRQKLQSNPNGVGLNKTQSYNLGDTGTHEVGHRSGRKAKGQSLEVENDETHRSRRRAQRTETVNNNETVKNPKQGNSQNLLPYMEQSNARKARRMNRPNY